jgi:trimeric autotransporter adhesin
MKINADASGFKLDPVQRALVGLGTEADKVTAVFDKFKGSSEAAGRAQEQFAQQAQGLLNTLRDGGSSTQFAADFEKLAQAARVQAAAFEEGARVTESVRTAEERRATELERLDRLLQQNAITEETYNRAKAEASGANAAAAQAEKERIEAIAAAQRERDKVLQDGVRITQQFATEEERRAQQISQLDALLAAAAISEETYARAKEQASGASKAAADAEAQRQAFLQEGSRLTEQYRTAEERRAAEIERINKLLAQGAISEDTAARAKAEASGANAAAAAAERDLAAQRQAAARIVEANLTGLERAQRTYDAALAETQRLEQAGLLTAAQANAERQRQAQVLQRVTAETEKASAAAKAQTLQFNELSGIFAALPGPLGNIAGRISGLSSAGEGLGRVFAGGLSQGISGVASSLAGLVNPVTAALAGITAFAAGATAVARGLTQLEDRVENLGNIADKLGVSFGFIQTLEEAANRSGTSIDAVSAAFGRLQKSVLGVDEESKAAQKALAEIGVTSEELQALSPEDQYRRIGESLAAIEDPARRTATATALFGKSGADLLPFFRNLGGAADDMQRFGAALSEAERTRIDRLGSAFDGLGVSLKALGQSLLTPFVGLAEGIAKALSGIVNTVTAVSQALGAVLTPVFDAAGAAVGAFGNAVNGTLGFFRGFFGVSEQTSQATQKVSENIKATEDAAKELAKALEQSNAALDRAIGRSVEFGQAGFDATLKYQNELQAINDLVAEGEYTAEQAARARDNATRQLDTELDAIKRVDEEKKRAADAAEQAAKREADAIQSIIDKTLEQIRVEQDFGGDTARARNAADLQRITEEIAKAEAEIARANASGDNRNAAAAAARLAQLDQVREALAETEAEFSDRADQTAQGFADGFDKAFEATTRGLDDLIDKAAEFGNEGAQAAEQLRQGIFRAQQQVEAGILTASAYQAEVTAQRRIYEERLAQLDNIAKLEQQRRDAEFQAQINANDRLNAYMQSLMGERQRAEAAATEAEFNRRAEAAENLKAIEDRITLQRKSVEAAREQNNLKSARARQQELKTLEDLRRAEQLIVDGKQTANRQIARAANTAQQAQLAQQQVIGNTAQRQIEATQQASSNAIGQVNNALAAAANKQRKLLEDLNTLGSRTVNTADVRTAEGAALVLGLAANAQDPRLIEARLTNKRLREVAVGLTQNLNRIGIPAAIL